MAKVGGNDKGSAYEYDLQINLIYKKKGVEV